MRLKPSLTDLFRSSIRSIFKNKIRTALTSLGIIIGVSSVILLVSIGNGLKGYVTDQFESLGSNFIYIAPGKVFNSRGGFNNQMNLIVSFTDKDVSRLERDLKPYASYVIPGSEAPVTVKYKTLKIDGSLQAVTSDYSVARNQNPEIGRWFSPEEDTKKAKVAVIGANIDTELFKNSNPIGKKINVNNRTLEVIGVMKKVGGGFGGPSFDDAIYVPLETGFDIIGSNKIQSIQIAVKNKDDIEITKKLTEKSMLKRLLEDEFSVFDQNQLLSSINSILGTITVALSGIAAISLVVGGIGIMNIMLVTVTERTKEIGLRKAIGAYPRAILLQFLFEATILSAVGGTAGIILGSLGTIAINQFFPAKVTIESILLAFGVSSIVGVIFGVAPARKASKLSPIEALRYE